MSSGKSSGEMYPGNTDAAISPDKETACFNTSTSVTQSPRNPYLSLKHS